MEYHPDLYVPANDDEFYQNSPCGLLSFSIDGKIIKVNRTLLNWLAIPASAVAGLLFTDLIDKGGKLYYQLFIQPMLRLNNEAREINISLKTPAGSIDCLMNASVAANQAQEIVHAAIFRIGERKKYEVELLNKKVRAEEEKQQKTVALEQVAFSQSHLVRLPLANILGLISLIDTTSLDQETNDLFEMIAQSGLQLDTAIKKIVEQTTA